MKTDSKKKYIFLVTRCIAGLFASCARLLIQCIYIRFVAPNAENFVPYVLALALYIGSTYALLGSYVGMAGILYLGVLNPIAFQQHLKLRIVYTSVCIIFLVSIALSIPLAIYQTAVDIPSTTVKCTEDSCVPLITVINFVLVTGSLIITIVALSFVLIALKRHRKKFEKLDTVSNTSLNSALHLLTWTLFAVILASSAEIISFVFIDLKKKGEIGELETKVIKKTLESSGCYWLSHSSQILTESSFALVESSLWGVALIMDPLANVILDTTVSKEVVEQVKWIKKNCTGKIIGCHDRERKRKADIPEVQKL